MIWDAPIEEAAQHGGSERPQDERASRGGIGRPTPKQILLVAAGIIGGGIAASSIAQQPSSLLELFGGVLPHGSNNDRLPEKDPPDDPGVVYVKD